jgi:hypothetical protein
MARKMNDCLTFLITAFCFTIALLIPQSIPAHCDTLDGPVVLTAMKALEKADVTPVLKWVKKEQEAEVRGLFKKTLVVRTKGPEAKELADRYFLETLVRLHRAGEGAPYTGISSGPVEPIIAEADQSLEKGSIDPLVKHLTAEVASGIRKRFIHTLEKKKHADESIDAGREFVEAYVDFTHYVERLYNDAKDGSAEHGKTEPPHKH